MPFKDPQKAKQYKAEYYQKNKERLQHKRKEAYQKDQSPWKNPDGSWKRSGTPESRRRANRKSWMKHRERYLDEQRLRRQNRQVFGTCPLCLKEDQRLVWDHCHETNEFRGYICSHCNLLLGHAFDDASTLERAIGYLKAGR